MCNGMCCSMFYIGDDTMETLLKRAAYAEPGTEWNSEISKITNMLIPIYVVKASEFSGNMFTCRHWDKETKLCRDYENRPKMCSDYPYGVHCQWCGDYGPQRKPVALIGERGGE